MEQFVDMPLQGATLWGVFASQLIGLFEFTANGGRLLIDLHLVPALLQEVGLIIIASVSIAEGNVFQVVIRFIETILHHVGKSGMPTCQYIYKHRFS